MSKENKENEKLAAWYEDHVVEDFEAIQTIAGMARRQCLESWNIDFIDLDEEPTDELVAKKVSSFYGIVYDNIIKALAGKRENVPEFAIQFADIVEIGYDNATDDGEMEKSGSFCPFIADLGGSVKAEFEPDTPSIERCTQWASTKLQGNMKILDEIATSAMTELHEEVNMVIGKSCLIIPLFCTIHDQIVKYMRVLYAEKPDESEVSINFINAFDIYCRMLENGETAIEYSPKPSQKLAIKSDAKATSPNEE